MPTRERNLANNLYGPSADRACKRLAWYMVAVLIVITYCLLEQPIAYILANWRMQ